ncbi:MAG: ribonuclease D [Acidihalobacter sp.]
MKSRPAFIDTPQSLGTFCHELAGSDWLAIDTEFLRERTYRAQLCLIQVANDTRIACIDPLAIADLSPLWELLGDARSTKILHAGYQDIELVYQESGLIPTPVFDSQYAAGLLGLGEQMGYARLVETLLGIELDKSQSRTDWSARPLSADQLTYAADDVRHLGTIYPRLRHELEQAHRLTWLEEDMAALHRPERFTTNSEEAWRNVRGAGALDPRGLAILQGLAAWREQEAMHRDKPRGWILRDEHLLKLCFLKPEDHHALEAVPELSPGFLRRYADTVLAAIRAGLQLEEDALPPAIDTGPPSAEERAQIKTLQQRLREIATQQSISAPLIANRAEIESLVRGRRDLRVLQGWRRQVAGEALLALLADQPGS